MNQIRCKFERDEQVKYISHLDVLKVFERAFIRANIPIEYSKGFNPRAKVIFGLPLAVGITSKAEYMDVELKVKVDLNIIKESLNFNLPVGIKVVDIKNIFSKQNIMSQISMAEYCSTVKIYSDIDVKDLIFDYLQRENIIVVKNSKNCSKKVNIRSLIKEISINKYKKVSRHNNQSFNEKEFMGESENNSSKIEDGVDIYYDLNLKVSAGNINNLRPDVLINSISQELNLKIVIISIERIAVFVEKDGKKFDPLDDLILIS